MPQLNNHKVSVSGVRTSRLKWAWGLNSPMKHCLACTILESNPPDSTRWCLASQKGRSWGRYHNVCLILIQEIRKPLWKAQRWFSCSSKDVKYPDFGIYNVIFVDLCKIKMQTCRLQSWLWGCGVGRSRTALEAKTCKWKQGKHRRIIKKRCKHNSCDKHVFFSLRHAAMAGVTRSLLPSIFSREKMLEKWLEICRCPVVLAS